MRTKTIRAIPIPRGNQPHRPLGAPIVDFAQEILGGREPYCILGVGTRPKAPCPIGRDGACAWFARSPLDFYCTFMVLRRWDEISTPDIADLIGVSKERLRQIYQVAEECLHALHDMPSP